MTQIPRTYAVMCLNIPIQNDNETLLSCAPIDLVIIFGVFFCVCVCLVLWTHSKPHWIAIVLLFALLCWELRVLTKQSKKKTNENTSRRFVCVCKATCILHTPCVHSHKLKIAHFYTTYRVCTIQTKRNKTNNHHHLPMILNGNLPTPQNLPINGACSSRPS